MKRYSSILALSFLTMGFSVNLEAAKKSRLVYGESGRIDHLDPYTSHEASAKRLSDLLFNSLVNLTEAGSYQSELAKSWKVGEGNTSVTFKLRKDVRWHGGKEKLSAKDVVTTIRLITAAESEIPNKERFAVISSAISDSPDQVTIRLKRAMVDPLRAMMFKILPAHALAKQPSLKRSVKFAKHPIGTGPYRFVKANKQGEILLEAYEKFFLGAPKIKSIVMKSYADQNVMAQSLMFSSLDLMTYVSPRDLNEIVGDKQLEVVPYDALSFTFFALNTSRGILRDKRVRQAITYGTNRQEMLNAFFQAKGQLISGPFPPTSWAYNLSVQPIKYDPKRARELLKAAGLKDDNNDSIFETATGKPVNLSFAVPLAGESEMIKRITLAFQEYMKKIGIKVDLHFMDWVVWKQKVLGKHEYDISIASWSFDDASNIASLFHSSSAKSWGNNFVLFRNQLVDTLLTEAEASNDADKKRVIYQKLHAILADEAPYTYLWTLRHHAAHRANIVGVKIEPFAFFKNIVKWNFKG